MGLGINRTGRINYAQNAYEVFQDAIFDRTGLSMSVLVTPEHVSIRSKNPDPKARYAEFVQAKSAIKGMTGLEIIHDFMG